MVAEIYRLENQIRHSEQQLKAEIILRKRGAKRLKGLVFYIAWSVEIDYVYNCLFIPELDGTTSFQSGG